jgi:hypothetical protein
MATNRVGSHRKEVSQLKAQFERLQQEVITKLKECNSCIESAERLNEEGDVLIRNLEDSLANISNDAKEWQQIRVKLASTAVKGKVILDVGGDKYSTSVETLTHEKNTFFTAMFSRQWELERDPKDDSIFIDRDGKLFTHILAYLRTDTVPNDVMTNETLRQKLILEARYFHLHNLIEILTKPDRINREGTLLSPEHREKLSEFCGNTQRKWELLYKASRDGFDATVFHDRCNNKGSTITIVQSTDNYLFGGYTSVAWTSSGNYAADSNAFLFTLTNPHNIPPTKYSVPTTNTQHTVYHNAGYGPTFGAGHDLHVCSNSKSVNSSYSGFPSTFADTTGRGNNTFTGSRTFMTTDIEVFKLA